MLPLSDEELLSIPNRALQPLLVQMKAMGVEKVEDCVERHQTLVWEQQLSLPALTRAIQDMDVEKVVQLAQNDEACQAQDSQGETPLFAAVRLGLGPLVKLVAQRSDVSVVNSSGVSALGVAALCGQIDAVKILAPLCRTIPMLRDEPLVIGLAKANRHEALAALLETVAADTPDPKRDQMTALMFAASKGHLESVNVLLAAGASASQPDTHQRNAVFFAAAFAKSECLEVLMRAHPQFDPLAQDLMGDCAWAQAVENEDWASCRVMASKVPEKVLEDIMESAPPGSFPEHEAKDERESLGFALFSRKITASRPSESAEELKRKTPRL